MKKKLVRVDNLDTYICSGKVYVDKTMILTAGAKDELSRRGIAIVYGAASGIAGCQPGCTCPACLLASVTSVAGSSDLERLARAVADILKNQYNVNDPEELKAATCQVLQTIKNNI